jgi:hypothetical protein
VETDGPWLQTFVPVQALVVLIGGFAVSNADDVVSTFFEVDNLELVGLWNLETEPNPTPGTTSSHLLHLSPSLLVQNGSLRQLVAMVDVSVGTNGRS